MDTVHARGETNKTLRAHASERTCLVTGETLPKERLIRFVVAPDGLSIVPDLAQNLPGRGLWVTASHEALANAIKKNLFSRAAKAPVRTDPGLINLVQNLLHKRCLDLMGLACGAGLAILGQTQVETAMKSSALALLLIATDGPQISHTQHSPCRRFTRDELGAAFGQDQLVYVGLRSHTLTRNIMTLLDHLDNFSPAITHTGTDIKIS